MSQGRDHIKYLDIIQIALFITNPLCASFIQDRKEILAELQFAFVCFLVGQGTDVLCRWQPTSVRSLAENMNEFVLNLVKKQNSSNKTLAYNLVLQ